MRPTDPTTLPSKPVPLKEVHRLFPEIRQSYLSSFDDCALSTLFKLKYAQGWSTHPQARGQLFHRFAAEALRTLRREDEESMPVTVAFQILTEVLRQADVPVEEIVRMPLRQIRELRMAVAKFANDNAFDVGAIIDIEKRLSAKVAYPHPETGKPVERVLSGQLDALLADPPDGAIVLDWKDTWGIPPDHSDDEDHQDDGAGISYHGYFQQRFYAWLVMENYPAVQSVTLREYYVRQSEPRSATVHRERLHFIVEEMQLLAEHFDLAVAAGLARKKGSDSWHRWSPSPGKHCDYCVKPGSCPIEPEARGEGAIQNEDMARRYAAEVRVAERVRTHRLRALKAWVDVHGPVAVKWAKGRLVMGWRRNSTGRGERFTTYVPASSDRGPHPADKLLVESMRAAAARARQAKRKRRRPGR